MKCYFPDLGCAFDCWGQISLTPQPFKSTPQIWVMTCHQYGISALMMFHGEVGLQTVICLLKLWRKSLLIFVTNTIFGPLLGSLSGTDYSGYNACFTRIYWIHFQSLITMERAVALLINLTITVQNGQIGSLTRYYLFKGIGSRLSACLLIKLLFSIYY